MSIKILGIETSCDDTAVAISDGTKIRASASGTSVQEHAKYGGIVPEIASRAHIESIFLCIDKCLKDAGMDLKDIDVIGVTSGPGLIGSLAVGVSVAKGLALSLGIPLYGINHVHAHILVANGEEKLPKKFIGLTVSGGHTDMFLFDKTKVKHIGCCLDDAAGETVDKIGRLLNMPYPAGPFMDKIAKRIEPKTEFPMGLMSGKAYQKHPYDFSFSGVKTAVVNYLADKKIGESLKKDVSAALQMSLNTTLVYKVLLACKNFDVNTVVVGGGYSANSHLRNMLLFQKGNIDIRLVPLELCTDNGQMICQSTNYAIENNIKPSQNIAASSVVDMKKTVL